MIQPPRSIAPLALTLLVLGCRPSASDPAADPAPSAPATPSADGTVSAPAEPAAAVVVVSVNAVEPGGEAVDAVLQTQAQWGTDQVSYRARVPADASTVALRFAGVTPGAYGVVAVQPNVPARPTGPQRAGPPAPSPDDPPPKGMAPAEPLPALSTATRGGWAASGATGERRRPDWAAAGVAIGPDGRTVALTLRRP